MFILADKTSNIYRTPRKEYDKLSKKNLTSSYKKPTGHLEKGINMKVKNISKILHLSDKTECLFRTLTFITFKDHKNDFESSLLFHQINSSKKELGKLNKLILENINQR